MVTSGVGLVCDVEEGSRSGMRMKMGSLLPVGGGVGMMGERESQTLGLGPGRNDNEKWF